MRSQFLSTRGVGAVLVSLLAMSPMLAAEELSVQASVSRRQVPLNGQLQLSVQVNGTQNVAAPDLQLDGVAVQYLGPSTRIAVVNGRMSSSIAHLYVLTPQKEGRLTIGPITVEVEGKTLQTEPIELEVLPASSGAPGAGLPAPQSPAADAEAPPAIGDALQLQLGVGKTQVYLNQALAARLQFLIGGLAVRGIEMPTIQADGFLVQPLRQPSQSEVIVGGQPYTLLEFDTVVVPLKTGTLSFGPASLDCQIVQRRRTRRRTPSPFGQDPLQDFFGNDSLLDEFFGSAQLYPVRLNAAPVAIEVLPLPEAGKPDDFLGAVGHFSLQATAVPTDVAAGEPITVTMTVTGTGNFASVNPPRLDGDVTRFKLYEAQQRQGADASRQKIFEQVVIPIDPSVRELPPIRLSYFDPDAGRYETLTQGSIPLHVTPAPTQPPAAIIDQPQTPGSSSPPEILGRDIIFIKEVLDPLRPTGWRWYTSWWWLLWTGSPIILLVVTESMRRRREWLAAAPGAVRASGAMKRAWVACGRARRLAQGGKASECYEEVFRVLQRYVGDRFNLSSDGLTRAELEQSLRPRGAPEDLVRDLSVLLDRCDTARFAPVSVATDQLDAVLRAAESILKRLERWRPA